MTLGHTAGQEPHAAVSAPRGHDASNPRIGERGRELAFPSRIVAGEVSRAAQEAGIPRDVVPLGEDPETGVEGLAIQGSGGRDDGDAIAGRERRRLDEARPRFHAGSLAIARCPRALLSPAILLQGRRRALLD